VSEDSRHNPVIGMMPQPVNALDGQLRAFGRPRDVVRDHVLGQP
jgi:hypothetical protein